MLTQPLRADLGIEEGSRSASGVPEKCGESKLSSGHVRVGPGRAPIAVGGVRPSTPGQGFKPLANVPTEAAAKIDAFSSRETPASPDASPTTLAGETLVGPAVVGARAETDDRLNTEREKVDEALVVQQAPPSGHRELPHSTEAIEHAVQEERAETDRSLVIERAEADRAFVLSEQTFQLLVEQVSDYAIFVLDPGGFVVSWNRGAERISGFPSHEILGRHFSVFYLPDDQQRDKPSEELRLALRDGRVQVEGWRVRKDGRKFRADVIVTALKDSSGESSGFVKIVRDVTESFTSAERQLRRSEEALRLATEAGALGTWDWDPTGDEMSWSTQGKLMLGIAEDTPMSLAQLLAVVHREDRIAMEEAVRQALDPSLDGGFEIEFRVLWPDESVHWLASRGRVSFEWVDGARVAQRFVGIVDDVTHRRTADDERERLVAQLDRAIQARDEFVAVLTHDLRNPLGAILLGASLVLTQLPVEMVGPRRRLMGIQTAAARSERLVKELLEEISLEGGVVKLALKEWDPSALLSEVWTMFEPGAHQRGVSLVSGVEAALPKVLCDRDHILRVFENLVGNAEKHTPAGGTIALSARRVDQQVRFAVVDTGKGISTTELSRVFERGFRGHRHTVGLGLGLSIAKAIVHSHGGEIGVESELDVGSTFWFTLRTPASGEPASLGP